MADSGMQEKFAPMANDVDVEAKGAARRKSSMAMGKHRKSTVVDVNAEVLESAGLNEADRRLAEMGYSQVSSGRMFLAAHMLTALRALGVQA